MDRYAPPDAPVVGPAEPFSHTAGKNRWFAVHLILWAMIAGLLYGIVPQALKTASDLGISLSTSAEVVSAASRWARDYLVFSVPLFAAVVWADYVALKRSPTAARPWRLGFWLTIPPLGLWLTAVYAFFSTLMPILLRLSG